MAGVTCAERLSDLCPCDDILIISASRALKVLPLPPGNMLHLSTAVTVHASSPLFGGLMLCLIPQTSGRGLHHQSDPQPRRSGRGEGRVREGAPLEHVWPRMASHLWARVM